MAADLSLEQIVQQDCLPARDCMLTVIDSTGEAAFLYFKEGELVEANYATLWGRDALTEILKWSIADHTLAPLPLGIKRSLWDPLGSLLDPSVAPTPSGRIPSLPLFRAQRPAREASTLDRYKRISDLIKMVEIDRDHETVLFEAPDVEPEETSWLVEFASRIRAVGDTLGFGGCDRWSIDTDKNQIVGFEREDKFIALVRRKETSQEDLETVVTALRED